MGACLFLKHMDENIAKVQNHPIALGVALYSRCLLFALVDFFQYGIRDCLNLGFGVSATNHEKIRQIRAVPQVQNQNILGFFVGRSVYDNLLDRVQRFFHATVVKGGG